MVRVACYIDGFNLYHALADVSRASGGAKNYLKWVCLRSLMQIFTDPKVHSVTSIKYFSAYATWKQGPYARHVAYVKALEHRGIEVILGRFKERDVYCPNCKTVHRGHEEKESDVNIATHLITDAFRDVFDVAFVVSRDSDLAPPIRLVRHEFPKKKVKVIAPPLRRHSKELWALAHTRADIKEEHVAICLLPHSALNSAGATIFTRPREYDPPPRLSDG